LELQEENGEGEHRPILVKLAPDLEYEDLDDLIDAAKRRGVDGFVATNTTIDHSGIPESLDQEGGLSGRPLREKSTTFVRVVARKSQLPTIGVGGIDNTESALEKFSAGACLVQLYTALIFKGPGVVKDIVDGLAASQKTHEP
jgi:dihydroorotate dehydrogenase